MEGFIPHICSRQGLATETINELPISAALSELNISNVNNETAINLQFDRSEKECRVDLGWMSGAL